MLGGIIEGVYAVDEQRRIRFVNPQAERLLKVSASQVTGAFCGDVLQSAARRERPAAVRVRVSDHLRRAATARHAPSSRWCSGPTGACAAS